LPSILEDSWDPPLPSILEDFCVPVDELVENVSLVYDAVT